MEQRVQKDRYLHLNGDKIENPRWKNLVLSATFLASVGTTSAALLYAEGNPANLKHGILFAGITGLLISRGTRHIAYHPDIIGLFSSGQLSPDSVIDTRHDFNEGAKRIKSAKGYISHSRQWGSALISAAALTPPATFYFAGAPSSSAMAFGIIPIITPLFSEGIAKLCRAHKVKTGEWTIIDKDKMHQEQTEEKTSLLHNLALN